MNTFKRYNKAIWFSAGWFMLFIMMQVFYMIVAFIFKMITDTEYLLSVQNLLQQASTGNTNDLFNAYVEIVGSITSYLELFLTIGVSGLLIIDREFHEYRFAFNKIKIVDIPEFISIGILMNILSTLFIGMFSTSTLEEIGYDTTLMLQGGFIGILIGVGICAPICEEITFRYFIYHNLNRGNQVLAIIVSSALFGIAHGNLLQGMYAFTFGLVFVMIDIKYNSIIPGIIMHISVNSLSVLLLSFDDYITQLLAMLLIFVISLIPTSIRIAQKVMNHEEIL